MPTLTIQQIWERLFDEDQDKRLFIYPIPSYLKKLADEGGLTERPEASLDLTLHNFFIVFERPGLPAIDFFSVDPELQIQKVQKRIFVDNEDRFWLHPGEFVLGGTREYFAMPLNLMANISGRSSWGRTGLIIETARVVHPGFCGTITLEMTNVGTVPIALSPGISVAQMVVETVEGKMPEKFERLTEPNEKTPRIQIKPEFSSAWESPLVEKKRVEQVRSDLIAHQQYMDKEGISL
jgi:deoxycytidine triphosphate deaminase